MAGCWGMATPEEKVLAKLEFNVESFKTDSKNKEEIHKILGTPLIYSNYWNLELYRHSATQSSVPIFVVFPLGYYWDTIYRYTFVTYDNNDNLYDISTCLYNEDSLASSLPQNKICVLDSGNYSFNIRNENNSAGVILYYPENLQVYVNSLKKEEKCSIFIASKNRHLSSIKIDKSDSVALWPFSILFYQVAPGEHSLEFTGSLYRGGKTIDFSCNLNENIFLEAELSVADMESHDVFLRGLTLGAYGNIGSAVYVINTYKDNKQWFDHFSKMPIMIWSDNDWILNEDQL